MADWTTIADNVLEAGDPVRSIDALALRDNPIAIAERALGAPGVFGAVKSVQIFTAGGTWTKPATNVGMVIVEVIGGGGGGNSGGSVGGGGGGGGGGYCKGILDVTAISSSTITVGAAGAAGGSNGGNSIWSDGTNTFTGNGGVGAQAGGSTFGGNGGDGGAASGGNLNTSGQSGSWGEAAVSDAHGGMGGSSPYGAGGRGDLTVGVAGGGFGAGGAGGGQSDAGGAGSAGVVVIWEY